MSCSSGGRTRMATRTFCAVSVIRNAFRAAEWAAAKAWRRSSRACGTCMSERLRARSGGMSGSTARLYGTSLLPQEAILLCP
eukprot:166634-Prymnesium_polylepis.2